MSRDGSRVWMVSRSGRGYYPNRTLSRRVHVETHGPLGTLWAGLGLGAFFLALTWVNLLLGHFLTPLFLIPLTWLQDAVQSRRKNRQG
ncbi:MAG: hypothetical protein ACT4OZ_11515 [Gemmatimonadota bacterium]